MKYIKLTQEKYAIVDDEDYEFINQYKWYANRDKNIFYAKRGIIIGGQNKQKKIWMHRIILERKLKRLLNINEYTDHRNHDGLDNRRDNLRLCNKSENSSNSNKHKKTSSQYKGVSWHKSHKKWRTQIEINRKSKHIGYFKNEIEAAKAYDEVAKELFGEFARINIYE